MIVIINDNILINSYLDSIVNKDFQGFKMNNPDKKKITDFIFRCLWAFSLKNSHQQLFLLEYDIFYFFLYFFQLLSSIFLVIFTFRFQSDYNRFPSDPYKTHIKYYILEI